MILGLLLFLCISVCQANSTPTIIAPGPCDHAQPGQILLIRPSPRINYDERQFVICRGKSRGPTKMCPSGFCLNEEKQLCDTTGTTTTGVKNNPLCANTELAYLPHPFDCTKLYKCYLNVTYELDCPNGFRFDKNEEKCTEAKLAECAADLRCTGRVDFFPHPSNCNKFIECYGKMSFVRECPPRNKYFNMKNKVCTDTGRDCLPIAEPSWAEPEQMCSNVADSDILLKSCRCGCQFYWQCNGKNQTLRHCPTGTIFDRDHQMCTYAHIFDKECEDSTRTPLAWTLATPLSVHPLEYHHPSCHDDFFTRNLRLFHPDQCDGYIQCHNKKAYELRCPEGLFFSSKLQKCVAREFSDCEGFFYH